MTFLSTIIDAYTLYYPIVMSLFWFVGACLSYLDYEEKRSNNKEDKVSIVVSVYNEEKTVNDLLRSLYQLNYSSLEIIIVDDKSTDNTLKKIEKFQQECKQNRQLKIIKQYKNTGKAQALNRALLHVTGKYMLVLDADSYLAKDAVAILLSDLQADKRNGAVTGRPVVRNRTTFLGKLQTLEYLNVIDNIKRSQNFLGAIMTVSGVLVMYRVQALKAIGGFNNKAMTEDIDVTWRLYKNGWQVKYNANALTYILVPERFHSLLHQRVRWSIGGLEVFMNHFMETLRYGKLRNCFLMIEMLCSQLWSWVFMVSIFRYTLYSFLRGEFRFPGETFMVFIGVTFALAFMSIRNDKGNNYLSLKDKLVVIIYLLFYWVINLFSNLWAFISILTKKTNEGKWTSPDRGV